MKICSKCGNQKSSDNFYKSKATKDGLCGYCKQCSKEYHLKWNEYNEDKVKKYSKKYREKNKKYREKNKEKISVQRRNYRKENKDKISNYRKENKDKISNYYKKYIRTPAIYSTYKNKLTIDEDPKLADDGVSLKVKCRYCGKYFIPTAVQVNKRIQALNGQVSGESNLYCSSGCKKSCPTFYQHKHYKGQKIDGSSREVQPQLRQMCLARDNYTCQKCGAKGKTIQLHCHHIKSLADDPIESADVDNTITLCKDCHKEAHKLAGCGYHELRCDST